MIITRTPLRISFCGGGTDLSAYYKKDGGAVISSAIDKYIYVTVNKKFDDSVRVSYSMTEIVDDPQDLKHDIVRESLKMTGITGGIEITTIADIPAGTGLGSSSSFTIGLLNALYSYLGITLSARELAEKACEIEIRKLKHPIGKQDQYAAAFGGLNFFNFNKDGTVDRTPVTLSERDKRKMDRKLMMYNTGVTRKADNILKEQREKTEKKRDILDFMKEQAFEMHKLLLKDGFTSDFGKYLNEGWLKKKSLTDEISNGKIDSIYSKALRCGATGGKLLGAGGGGFILLYCDEEKQDLVREEIGLREIDFHLVQQGSRVVYFA